jgi:hypothetical protein
MCSNPKRTPRADAWNREEEEEEEKGEIFQLIKSRSGGMQPQRLWLHIPPVAD